METRGALLQFYLGHVQNKRCSARLFPIWRVQWLHWMTAESTSSLQTLVAILSSQALTDFSHTAQGCSPYPLSVRKKLGCRSSERRSLSHTHLCVELGGVHRYLWLYALEFNGKTAQLLLGFNTSSASPKEKRARFTTASASITPYSFPFSNRKTNHITFSLQPTLWPLDGDFPICKWQRPLKAVSWPGVLSLYPPSRSCMSTVVLLCHQETRFCPKTHGHAAYSDSHPASPLPVLCTYTSKPVSNNTIFLRAHPTDRINCCPFCVHIAPCVYCCRTRPLD